MICVYPADCTDFSTNGNGSIEPLSAEVTETLNGEYELTVVHPIDEAGKWQRLVEGCILCAPVPAATTPRVHFSAPGDDSGMEIYRIHTDFPGAETRKGTLNLRSGPGRNYKILAAYKNTLTVQVIAKISASWYEVTAPDGKHGYMDTTYLVYDHTEGIASEAVSSVVDERQLRDQPFRIYRIVPELDQITVYARHVFYDLLDNMIKSYKPSSSAVGASVVQTVSSSCLSDHDFTFYSDLDSTAEDVEFENVNPVDAILGEDGVVEKYTGELTRDWWDVFVVKRVGQDTNVQIRQAKNLLGISYDIDLTDVVTRIMPTGEDADGNVLYLPELYIDSPLIDTYTHPKWIHLPVSEAKEDTDGDDAKTKAECYTLMRDAAQAQFDAGCDVPTVTLDVSFINCAETEEYAEYGFLQNIFLGDAVRVIAPRIGVWVSMRMTQYTYDCLTRKYTQMTLGTVADTVEGNTISARQLPSGIITGSKLAINSVGSGALQNGSVGSLQIKMAAIETAHIEDAAITKAKIGQAAIGTAQIEDAAVTKAKIGNAAIGTAQIEDAAITQAKIGQAAIGTAQIEDGTITSAKIGSGEIQTANIHDGAITHAKIGQAAVDTANIKNAAVDTAQIKDAAITNAKIGGLAVGTANIQDAAIVAAKILDGEIVTAKIAQLAVTEGKIADLAVTTAKIAQAAITNAKIANAAVDTAQIALGAITTALIAQGAIGTAQIADASITAAKVVSLNADVITSGTLATERLIITGANGIIYEINAEASGLSVQELQDDKYKEQINGTVIVARSITAQQIAAATITANEILAATITGDKIAAATIEGSNIKAGAITTSHPVPKGKRPGPSLREMEKQIGKDFDSMIDPSQKGMLVIELVDRYLKTKTGVRPNTTTNYNFVRNVLAQEDFSCKKIGEVKTSDAKLFLIGLQDVGKGHSTIKCMRGVLRPAFQMAVDDDLLAKNPFAFQLAGVIIDDSVTREAISKMQMKKFLKFVHDDNCYCKYYEIVYILFHTGMRISEFCGLTLYDIDFENHLINIDHQLIRTPDMALHVQATKTSAGKRKLPMTKEVEDCFRAIVEDREMEKASEDGIVKMEKAVDGYRGFLFLDDAGLPLVAMHWEHRFNNMVNRYNAIYKEQMPNITPHVCRHTYCSNMAKAGMNPKTLQYLMGHSDITVTLDTYTHLGLEDAAEELKRLAEVEQARKEQEKLNQNRDDDDSGIVVAM